MKKTGFFFLCLMILISCNRKTENKKTLFTLLPASRTKIDFVNHLKETEKFNIIEYLYFNNGAGVAAGDINNDGLTDLYFVANQRSNKLYLNRGNFRFEDITKTAGAGGAGDWTTGVTMADVNGDGRLDIYVCHVGDYKGLKGKNQLFINQGNLTFKEEAASWGLDFQGFSTQAAFFDYDLDGDLDMYLLNHSVHTSRSYGGVELRHEKDFRAGDRLYRNDLSEGKLHFQDVTMQAGIYSSQIGYGLGVNISDLNNDGLPDIYISNDFHENDYLYINNGNGTFSEKLRDFIEHTSRSSMGNDVGDINNDGLMDIVVLDMLPDEEKIRKQSGGEDDYELFQLKLKYGYAFQFVRNTLQLNLGGGMFSEIGRLAGIYSTDWSWSPLVCDVNNDGYKDIFITNGIYRRANDLDYIKFLTGGNRYDPARDNRNIPDKVLYEKMPLYPNINYIFKNNADLTFTNKATDWGFRIRSFSNGATYADLDNDGDQDLVVNNINDDAFVFKNNSEALLNRHFLSFRLLGDRFNRYGLGTRITLYNKGTKQVSENFPTRGFMSSTTEIIHFGLDTVTKVDSVVFRWPDRSVQVLRDVKSDQIITVKKTIPTSIVLQAKHNENSAKKWFSPVHIPGLVFHHREDAYTDFSREQLIPHSLSAEGPPLAVADVNGDGLEDVFIGGAAGQAAVIFLQNREGSFTKADEPVFLKDRITEDTDAAFFDADGDGDPDLYVVRGGNEYPAGNPMIADRLLINDGKGDFQLCKPGSIPFMAENGSCVRPCDFDKDGDMDLFVGARSVPGAYGIPPKSFLLRNNGMGDFEDVTQVYLNDLDRPGMVTDAVWTDYDGDGDPDLVLVGEWMKICIFRNDDEMFTDVTNLAGMRETSGWWNTIVACDVDRDGDTDLIAGNLGLNSVLKASVKEPVEMYLQDFDNNGSLDQVICSFQDGVSYPVASLDELERQINGLKERFPKYSDFGGKTVRDIFGEDAVNHAMVKKAVLFESCLFLNDGQAHFNIRKLPVFAQFSPVRDILAEDMDHNGTIDMVLAGNDYTARPSLGRYDASFGWVMPGKGNHRFSMLRPVESGLKINGDARKICSVQIAGDEYIIVSVNNGNLQIFKSLH